MPEDTNTVDENATQGAPAEKTFTQAELDAIVGDRLKRERAKYADYSELQAKAAKFDEAEEAGKSELQKAVEERDKLRAQLDQLKADKAHAELVAKVAAEKGVDAEMLARMTGDVEDNAAFLAERNKKQPMYGRVPDSGEASGGSGAHASTSGEQFAEFFRQTIGTN